MFVVATTSNFRGETPALDMEEMMGMEADTVPRTAEWFPVFNRSCSKVVVTGSWWHSLVTIRGSTSDLSLNLNEIRVGGNRCPINEVNRVCNLGHKTVVDLVVALDPTGIVRGDSGWTFDVVFPAGFTPMCYISNKSSLQYLSMMFETIGVMAVDVTPVSYTLIWDIPEECGVELNDKLVAEGQFHKMEVLNAAPGETTRVKVRSQVSDSFATLEVETPPMTVEFMRNFYASRKADDGVFDLEGVKNETLTYLRKNNILRSGDEVHMRRPEDDDPKKSCTMSVVVSGDTVPLVAGKSMYVVPDFSDREDKQYICIEDESSLVSHVLEFDKSESYVKFKGAVYPHGATFTVAQNEVTVVKGSIILIVSDDVPAEFPGGDSAALQVLSSGDLVVRDLVMRCSSQVTEKVTGGSTYGRNSFFTYNPEDGTTKECTRVSHGLNEAGDTGSISVDLLYTNANSQELLVNTMFSDPSQTCITSRTPEEEVVTATFNATGLSFDSDNGNIYFGADKDFRIHFEDKSGLDPAMLQIQSLSLSGDEYLTRFLITAEPP